MSRKKNKNKARFEDNEPSLHPDVKRTIGGIIVFLAAVLLILSYFSKAGVLGRYIYGFLDYAIGAGFFVLIILLFASSYLFFLSEQKKIYKSVVFGALIILASLLGILHFLSPQQKYGGLVGSIAAYPLDKLVGFWAGVIILIGFTVIGFVVLFGLTAARIFGKKDILPEIAPGPALPMEKPQEALPAVKEAVKPPQTQPGAGSKPKEIAEKPVMTAAILAKAKRAKATYELPPLDLLEKGGGTPTSGDIKAYSTIIKRTLENFGIPVEMGEINIGPTVTQYTLKPAEGVKLSKITSLHNDLALALAAHPIRIEAPIPGRSLVGIEIPNRVVALVRLRTLLETEQFKNAPSLLSFPLGFDVAGNPVFTDLSRLPHLLIAGATGTGKSVGIHAIITSLLFHNYPTTLKFLIIDPKRVELSVYEDIPHLISPVVVEPMQAVNALRWATKEMDRRYKLLSSHKTRDIISYNNKIAGDEKEEFLPYLVIVVDELADLMSMYGREVEGSIVRLAQMARAVGIHVIISTQRPSVEVITGLIKANVTTRIAFQVASHVDSRTILDTAGAEKLLGNGDMLFVSAESAKPRRIQACYISEKEVKRVVDYLQGVGWETEGEEAPDFSQAQQSNLPLAGDGSGFEGDDPMYNEAKRVVIEAQKASASLLQRRLKLGYARAARMLDMLEQDGVIGPGEGAKPRQVFLKPDGGVNTDIGLPGAMPDNDNEDEIV